MAIIDCVKWQPQGGKTIYAYRYPECNLSTYTQLIVQESQEALLFSKGQLMAKFGPGKHTLNTENIPILRNLYGIPFGGKNPFTAEVWFINKVQTFAIEWRIDRMTIHDVDYQTQLPLVASGQYGLKVIDAEKFIIKFVGTKYTFTEDNMTEQSYGEFCSKSKSLILQYMLQNSIGFKQISAFLDSISENLKIQMQQFWSDLGLELTKFYVTSIEIDDSTPDGQRVKEAIAQQASMSITGHSWQQEQMFKTADSAIGSVSGIGGGNGGGLLGGLMAIQMMNNMGGGAGAVGGGMMQTQYNQPTFGGNGNAAAAQAINNQQVSGARMVYCASCSKKFSSDQAFCPHCGKKYNPCPRCGADNADNAKRCVSCGAQLGASGVLSICPKCGSSVNPGARFCGNCGSPIASANSDNRCPRCGAEMAPDAKFCPKCGSKR